MSESEARALLEVRDLHVAFDTLTGPVYAVNGVSLYLDSGELLCILGESGCGKTATAKTIAGILQCPPGRIRNGSICYKGQELTRFTKKERRRLMGKEIAWIPQDALSALNPSFRIGYQLVEGIRNDIDIERKAARSRAMELLSAVGLAEPEQLLRRYPHELSGGMRQRVLIAMALGGHPTVLIADEPTTALDVTIQAENILLLKRIQVEQGMGVVLITHDCGLAGAVADRVAIMYAGQIVETGPTAEVFSRPAHPYTRGLLHSTPSLAVGSSLSPIPGTPPKLREVPTQCPYVPRCPLRVARCEQEVPPAFECGTGRYSACFRFQETLSHPPVRRFNGAGTK
jgi:oligopeptide/dipeptide ABC transporter ATP-binding protein